MNIVKTITTAAAVIAISATVAQAGAPSASSLDNALSASGFATQSIEFQHTSTDRSNTGAVMNYRTYFKSGKDNIVVLSDKNGKPFEVYKATYLLNLTSTDKVEGPTARDLDIALSTSDLEIENLKLQHTSVDRDDESGEVMNYRTHFKTGKDNIVVLSDKNGKPFQVYKATYLIDTTSNNVHPFVPGDQG